MRNLIKKKRMNKKAGIGIIIFFSILLITLILGFISVLVWSVVDIAADELVPIMSELGMAGDSNLSEYSEYGIGTANIFVQAIPWLIAFGYIMVLIFTLVFVFIVGYNPHPSFIAFYFALMLLLIIGCVVMSNMYQDIYTGDDEIATRLQEQTIMSYLLLHSPFIMAMIATIGGILMFARQSSAEGGVGGYGV